MNVLQNEPGIKYMPFKPNLRFLLDADIAALTAVNPLKEEGQEHKRRLF
jgi:hypothetical protein